MGGLFGGGKSTQVADDQIVGINLQTSAYGGVVPIAYGTTRLTGNVIWMDDLTAIPHTSTQQTGKGGGGGSSITTTTYTYTAAVMLALCEGATTLINRVWRDKDVGALSQWWDGYQTGTVPQTAWSYFASGPHTGQSVGYAGTVSAYAAAVDLGNSATLKNFSFEVSCPLAIPSGTAGYPDANPDQILVDFLTNSFYGAGWASSRIANLTSGASSFKTYCTAAGFFLSPVYTTQAPAADQIKMILDATNSEAVWSDGGAGSMVLKVIPYGDTSITGNSTTYTPNTTPLYNLGLDDFLVSSPDEDPVSVERVSPADAFNCVPVSFNDRALNYDQNIVEDPDPVDVETFGLKKASTVSLPCVAVASIALQISRIKAQRLVYCRNRYRFRLGWRYCLLEPMDLVNLTEPRLGLNLKTVRIREIEESEEGELSVVAEEWPFGVASATLYTSQTGDGTVPNVNADPGNANAPVIFDVPALYRNGIDPEIMIGTSGGSIWGSAEVWVSADGGATYVQAGAVTAPARHGTLSGTMAAGTLQQDTTSTCPVDLSVSKGTLSTVPAQTAVDGTSLCYAGGELFSYQTATLTGANQYTLQTLLSRGLWGTTQASHATSTPFVRVDAALLRVVLPATRLGTALRIKLVSLNIWGGGKQSLGSVPYYSFTPGLLSQPAPTSVSITIT